MKEVDIDIPLTKEEEEEKLNFLKKTNFSSFRIHPYYNRNSYIKHGVEIQTIKEIYPKFDKIIKVFKRPASIGYKYSFVYKLEEIKYLVLCFYLDEKPPVFFNAYYNYTRLDKNLQRKVKKWMKREFNN